MKARIIEQCEPAHWAPDGGIHNPRLCALCAVSRIGRWLGLIACEEDFGADDGVVVQTEVVVQSPAVQWLHSYASVCIMML